MFIQLNSGSNEYLINLNQITRVSKTHEHIRIYSGKDHYVTISETMYEQLKQKIQQLHIDIL